ncbi:MAG TPA: calcium-binding protein [Gemmataceae bacterium]|jgi:Ca2+-binding RTX toxin-like protein|nr:calcium-binding protein [Gemmataceae bacterium]
MAAFTGTASNDSLVGTTSPDTFDMSQGGDDTVSGLDGDDVFSFGAAFTPADQIDGGTGNDTLVLSGNYASQTVFAPATIQNVEAMTLVAGFDYNLKTDDQNVAAGQRLSIDSSLMGSGDKFTFDGSAESNGFFTFFAGPGNDVLTGGNTVGGSCDFFFLQAGGNDIANGGGGSDDFLMGGALTAADQIDGGPGGNVMVLDGDYSAGVTFNATTVQNISLLWLNGGHSYKLITADSTVAAGQTLDVNFPILSGPGITGPLGPGDSLYFDGSAETDGSFIVAGSPGNDTLIGGAGNDELYSGAFGGITGDGNGGGNDVIRGGAGDDTIFFGGNDFNAQDTVDGGPGGNDFLILDGDFSAGLTLSSNVKNIEVVQINDNGTPTVVTTTDSLVAAGKTLRLEATQLTSSLTFHGQAETNGNFIIDGGSGNDTIRTGAGNDQLWGGAGADRLRGGAGADTYEYNTPADSTSTHYDTIVGFNAKKDKFDLNGIVDVTGVDAKIASGALSTATFDTDLAAAVNAAHLKAQHAVLFTPTSGTLAGDTFLIIDGNGTAGYQTSQDYVMHLVNAVHLADLHASDFLF